MLQIALKSILNGNYVRVNHQEGKATANGHHPILYVSALLPANLFHLSFLDRYRT